MLAVTPPGTAPAGLIKTVAIISTEEVANHRGRLIEDIVATGRRVIAFSPFREDIPAAIMASGGSYCPIPMNRTGLGPLAVAREVRLLAKCLRQERVDLVFTAGTRPNVVGTLAAVRAGINLRYAMIAGLGYTFTGGPGLQHCITRNVMSCIRKRVYRLCGAVFVQNEDDLRFVREAWARSGQPVIRTYGSGVDLNHFYEAPPPDGPPKILFISRLLREKGIYEYAEAARIVKRKIPEVRFQMLGRTDSNPGSITQAELALLLADGAVEYLGATSDVREYLRNCSVFVLPSYYREGVPRTTLEALATGRAIVTTDTPGCRDTVDDGVNGYTVPPRDAGTLAAAIERIASNPQTITSMGHASRQLAAHFDVRDVNAVLMEVMRLG